MRSERVEMVEWGRSTEILRRGGLPYRTRSRSEQTLPLMPLLPSRNPKWFIARHTPLPQQHHSAANSQLFGLGGQHKYSKTMSGTSMSLTHGATTAVPEEVGLSAARLDRLASWQEALVADERLPCTHVTIVRNGRVAYNRMTGFADVERQVEIRALLCFLLCCVVLRCCVCCGVCVCCGIMCAAGSCVAVLCAVLPHVVVQSCCPCIVVLLHTDSPPSPVSSLLPPLRYIQVPLAENSILRMYSMSKPIVSVALLMLLEEGLVQLSDPVHLYLGAAWKKKNMSVYVRGTRAMERECCVLRGV